MEDLNYPIAPATPGAHLDEDSTSIAPRFLELL